jgi:hypothetical protein
MLKLNIHSEAAKHSNSLQKACFLQNCRNVFRKIRSGVVVKFGKAGGEGNFPAIFNEKIICVLARNGGAGCCAAS